MCIFAENMLKTKPSDYYLQQDEISSLVLFLLVGIHQTKLHAVLLWTIFKEKRQYLFSNKKIYYFPLGSYCQRTLQS